MAAAVASSAPVTAQTGIDRASAAHFLEHATFGPTVGDISAVQGKGPRQWLLEQLQAPESPVSDGLNTAQLRAQLFMNMASGQDQLRQRMVFALSQIFVVSANKVTTGPELTPWVRLLSRNAFGNYRTLLREATLNPTMGKYLDLAYSRKATRTTSINENYAREMLQLFSIGLYELNQDGTLRLSGGQPISTYSQGTIGEFARALTGWTFPTQPGMTPATNNPQYFVGELEPRPVNHDTGAKQLFGGLTIPANQTPAADLENVIDVVFQHPNVPPFLATRLIRSLVKSNPSPGYIGRVAAVFANNGYGERGNLASTLAAVLLDPEAATFSASDGRLKDPLLHAIGLGRALNAEWLDVNAFMYIFGNLSEQVLTPASVFSFFSPLATLPGSRDLFAPEFAIYPPALAIQRGNFLYSLLFNGFSTAFRYDLSPFLAVAANDTALVEAVNYVLLQGTMSPALREIVITATRALPATQTTERARGALYLTAISSEYAVHSAGGGGSQGAVPAAGAAGAPSNLTGSANGPSLSLSWRNAAAPNAPTSVVLEVSGALSASIPLALTESFSYNGVPPGTYTFSVRGVNGAGPSASSNALTLTFGGCTAVPQVPAAFNATRSGNVVTVTWQPPAAGPAPTGYVLRVGGALSAAIPTSGLSLGGAVPAGSYALTVNAVNGCGSGPASASRTVTVP